LEYLKAEKLVNDEFNNWKKKYPYQVKLKPVLLSPKGFTYFWDRNTFSKGVQTITR